MTAAELKEQLIKAEAFADGIKQGCQLMATWMAQKLDKEQQPEVKLEEVKN